MKGQDGQTERELQFDGNYVMIQAMEDGVTIFGLTRGIDTKFHHSERLDQGEVLIAQFTTHTSAIKVRGKAKIYTNVGQVDSGR